MSLPIHIDRRKSQRFGDLSILGVIRRGEEEGRGFITDLSVEGLRMLLAARPHHNEVVDFELSGSTTKPDVVDIKLKARCVWTAESVLPGHYDCGFQFQLKDAGLIKKLADLISNERSRLTSK